MSYTIQNIITIGNQSTIFIHSFPVVKLTMQDEVKYENITHNKDIVTIKFIYGRDVFELCITLIIIFKIQNTPKCLIK